MVGKGIKSADEIAADTNKLLVELRQEWGGLLIGLMGELAEDPRAIELAKLGDVHPHEMALRVTMANLGTAAITHPQSRKFNQPALVACLFTALNGG